MAGPYTRATTADPYYAEPSITYEIDANAGDAPSSPVDDSSQVDGSDHQAVYGPTGADVPAASETPSPLAGGVNNLDPAFNAYAVGGVAQLNN